MTRPALELADVFRAGACRFLRWHHASFQQVKVIRAITRCRTAALGGHIDACTGCGKGLGPVLQLLQEPALSQVSDSGPSALAHRTHAGSVARCLLPCRVHAPAQTQHVDSRQSRRTLQPLVPFRRRDPD